MVNQISATQSHKETPKISENDKKKTTSDWWLVAFTFVLALVAVLQLVVIVWQITTTREATEKELRAYVFPVAANRFTDNGVLKLKVVLENSGKTPALKCSSWAFEGVANMGSPLPAVPKIEPRTDYFIAPGATAQILEDALVASGEEFAFISNGIRSLYLVGEITYEDVFHKKHITKFRLISRTTNYVNGLFTFCDAGNEAT